jgi:zinc transport system substrate-binding protein
MKTILFLLAFAATVGAYNNTPLHVATSLIPYATIIGALGGERVTVTALVEAGANPHIWEPNPKALKEFSQAQIYFTDSSGMDKPWIPRFVGVNRNVHIVSFQYTNFLHEHDHDDELDPHLWSSPQVVIAIAPRIAAALMAADPQGMEYYKARLASSLKDLYAFDAELKSKIAKLPQERRKFIVYHPSLGYLARDYGLTQISIEMGGKEPKPQDLAHLVEEAREHGIRTIFVQPQFNKASAASLAKEMDGKVEPIDPLQADWEGMIRKLIDALSESLSEP